MYSLWIWLFHILYYNLSVLLLLYQFLLLFHGIPVVNILSISSLVNKHLHYFQILAKTTTISILYWFISEHAFSSLIKLLGPVISTCLALSDTPKLFSKVIYYFAIHILGTFFVAHSCSHFYLNYSHSCGIEWLLKMFQSASFDA